MCLEWMGNLLRCEAEYYFLFIKFLFSPNAQNFRKKIIKFTRPECYSRKLSSSFDFSFIDFCHTLMNDLNHERVDGDHIYYFDII